MSHQNTPHNATVTITIRLGKTLKSKLERLAQSTNRSLSFLAAEAITEYAEGNEWQITGIKKAMKDLNADKTVSREKVSAWVDSLGTDYELPPPTSSD